MRRFGDRRAVLGAREAGPAPLAAESLSAAFGAAGRPHATKVWKRVLRTLVAAGVAQERSGGPDGGSRFFIPR